MALTIDVPLLVYLVPSRQDHLRRHWQVPVRQDHPVERDFQVPFAHEVARLLVCLQVAPQHAAPRKQRFAELLHRSQVTQHRIADGRRFRRKVRLVHRALQQRARRHQNVLRPYRSRRHQYRRRAHHYTDESSHNFLLNCHFLNQQPGESGHRNRQKCRRTPFDDTPAQFGREAPKPRAAKKVARSPKISSLEVWRTQVRAPGYSEFVEALLRRPSALPPGLCGRYRLAYWRTLRSTLEPAPKSNSRGLWSPAAPKCSILTRVASRRDSPDTADTATYRSGTHCQWCWSSRSPLHQTATIPSPAFITRSTSALPPQ